MAVLKKVSDGTCYSEVSSSRNGKRRSDSHLAVHGVPVSPPRQFPEHLLEAVRYFSNPDACAEFVASVRWPSGVACPHCGGKKLSFLTSRRRWKCMAKGCQKQFSVKTGCVFENSPIELEKWLTAVWLLVNCKKGVSSYEIMRYLGVTQQTGWYMLHRVRLALDELPDAGLTDEAAERKAS